MWSKWMLTLDGTSDPQYKVIALQWATTDVHRATRPYTTLDPLRPAILHKVSTSDSFAIGFLY
eukprot:m.3244 g.3244  ORF g.3244 m.3244 type:complete len:63 (+) comp2171_c0_seq1:161-349(+)